ncbi:MAG: hypothetical protein CM15mP85_24990 [Rhodobacterales bacterium]|nr:MAG: hypothetical protein CM15mP85_24990 [Rhodobacterales bacterium]
MEWVYPTPILPKMPRILNMVQNFWNAAREYVEAVGWTGDDVWHAHCVQLNSEEINLFAKTGKRHCSFPLALI